MISWQRELGDPVRDEGDSVTRGIDQPFTTPIGAVNPHLISTSATIPPPEIFDLLPRLATTSSARPRQCHPAIPLANHHLLHARPLPARRSGLPTVAVRRGRRVNHRLNARMNHDVTEHLFRHPAVRSSGQRGPRWAIDGVPPHGGRSSSGAPSRDHLVSRNDRASTFGNE